MATGRPNLFTLATSELSQDAVLAWLLSWADPECAKLDMRMHACAVDLTRFFLGESGNYEIQSLEVGRQWKGIDVWAEINDEYFLLIEDKKNTREHSNQLKRYLDVARNYYIDKKITVVPVYFKMEEQGIWSGVKESGYKIVTRCEILDILRNYVDTRVDEKGNDILLDYYLYLDNLDSRVNGFSALPLEQWQWHTWQGFFSSIQDKFGGEWDYVPNPSGGFLGFWWGWRESKHQNCEFEFYLQLEFDKLVFKICTDDLGCRISIREHYRKVLYATASEKGIDIEQYGRLGKYMGVARMKGDYRVKNANGALDMGATILMIQRAQALIDAVNDKLNCDPHHYDTDVGGLV